MFRGLFAGFGGVVLGMISARSSCINELQQHSDSLYGRYLHHKKYGQYFHEYESRRDKNYPELINNRSNHIAQPNAFDMDTTNPTMNEFDEYKRFPNGSICSHD